MTDRYRVSAPYVTVKVRDDFNGTVLRGFYADAILPESVDLDDLARHIRKGMVEKVEGAEAKAVDKQRADEEKAAAAVEVEVDKEGEAAVKKAEADKAAADKAAAEEEKAAAKAGTPLIKAADSKPGSKTAG